MQSGTYESSLRPTDARLHRILDPEHPLCKEDIVWVLEWIKKKVVDQDPSFLNLSQPQMLRLFHDFAEVAMLLIHKKNGEQEITRLKTALGETVSHLHPG